MVGKKQIVYIYTLVTLILLSGAVSALAQGKRGLIAEDATLTEVQAGFQFTEGPAADRDGNIYFTDVRAERIYKWSHTDNSIVVYREKTGGANGLMFDPQGRLIVCEMGQGRLVMDDGRGALTMLAEEFEGQKLHGPNDVWIDANGGIYFSDWIGGRKRQGSRDEKQPSTLQVYYLTPDHNTLLRVTNDLKCPNGVIGTSDGKTLYIADMGAKKTWIYTIQPDGTLTDKRLFCEQGSDGIALDTQGNLYLTTDRGLTIYNPDGIQIDSITVPTRPTNMTFGGADRRTLFITARTAVYTLEMAVKGAATPLDRGDYTQKLDAVTAATKLDEYKKRGNDPETVSDAQAEDSQRKPRRNTEGRDGRKSAQNRGGSRQPAIFHTEVPEHPFDIILGRPTDRAVTLSILTYQEAEGYIEYGLQEDAYTEKTDIMSLKSGMPMEVDITTLQPDTQYYYRFHYREPSGAVFHTSEEYIFHTHRPTGSEFTFTIQADSHLDQAASPDVYTTTLSNALADRPDFHIALGDTFMTDKYRNNYKDAFPQYLAQRYYFGLLCHSAPLFWVLGNHDGEIGSKLDGTENNMTIWSNRVRKQYYPNPFPDGFYSGNDTEEEFVGLPENYYAWEWGDALFVALDPYWSSTNRGDDPWDRTLGDAQYQWLTQTLEQSEASFKFVFIHYLLGGKDKSSRGGVAIADKFEWGGHNSEGVFEFSEKRPGWEKPIHQLLVENNVSIVFHGHDHLFAKEDLDGIVYQLVPQPGSRRYDNTRTAQEYGYVHGDVLSSPGHLRVAVSEESATVEYVRSYLPKDEKEGRVNGEIAHSYSVDAR